jgi:hypothetical protein
MSDEKKPKKWPVGPATLFTIVASIVAELNFFHEMLGAQVTTLGRTAQALGTVDAYALAVAYVGGMRSGGVSVTIGTDSQWAGLVGFKDGIAAVWNAMVAGGIGSIVAGVCVVACGIGIVVLASYANANINPFVNVVAVVSAVFLSFILVVSVAIPTTNELATVLARYPIGISLRENMNAFASGFDQAARLAETPSADEIAQHVPPVPKYSTFVGAFVRDFVAGHFGFVVVMLLCGIVALAAIFGVAIGAKWPLFLLALLPFYGMTIVFAGALVATLVNHILLIGTIKLIIAWLGIVTVPPIAGLLVGAIENGHNIWGLVESTKKILGRE